MMVVSADSPSTPCTWWHKLHNLTCCCPSLSILLLTLSRRVLMLSCSHSPNCIFCVCVWVCCTRWPLYSSQPSHEHRYLKTVFSFSNSDTVYTVYLLNIRNITLAVASRSWWLGPWFGKAGWAWLVLFGWTWHQSLVPWQQAKQQQTNMDKWELFAEQ